MKLTTVTHVSLDGVMQGLGGADEDRRGGFERGGWALPFMDNEGGAIVGDIFQRADAFLFGRSTYELFAGYWGQMDDSDNPIAQALNSRPKYVVSTTLDEGTWEPTTVIADDVAAHVADLKTAPPGEIQVHGSGILVRWLLDQGLVDNITLLTYPVIIGQGTRLFPETGRDVALEPLESQSTTTGITVQTFRPHGRPEYAS